MQERLRGDWGLKRMELPGRSEKTAADSAFTNAFMNHFIAFFILYHREAWLSI